MIELHLPPARPRHARASPKRGPATPPRSPHCTSASFQRGWGEDEVYGLLIEKQRRRPPRHDRPDNLIGFILSRIAAGEAEILSVAIAPAWRGRGLARPLLDLHLRRLAGLGARAVFLEVDEHNAPARALYRRAGFSDVGRRKSYYQSGATRAGAAPRSRLTRRRMQYAASDDRTRKNRANAAWRLP